ncbi:MAG: pyrroloquinoline quinone precursor peptide PqqA, partial [Betaproteobacteria bacterium]|nr:pyrroloquinoline quinone precursor peptide PqqA [Betaproteobacteria bacterium]
DLRFGFEVTMYIAAR